MKHYKTKRPALLLGLALAIVRPAFTQAPAVRPQPELSPSLLAQRARDFDIREMEKFGGDESVLVAQRKTAAEQYRPSFAPGGGAGVRITLSETGLVKALFNELAPLTAPSDNDPEQIAREFLRAHSRLFGFSDQEVAGLRLLVRDVSESGIHLAFNQTLNGIDVFHGHVKFTLNSAGQIVRAGVGDVIPQLSMPTNPRLNAMEAVQAVFRTLRLEPPVELVPLPLDEDGRTRFRNPRGDQYGPMLVELSILPLSANSARLAYRILVEIDGANWFETLLDADDAKLLFRHNLVRQAGQGRVWKESPIRAPREVAPFPDSWLAPGARFTTGNNVDAYLDTDGNNAPDTSLTAPFISNGRPTSAAQNFDFPAGEGSTGQDPRDFPAAAATNLFYLVNAAHDYYYTLGFDEASGNFQIDNFGRGGRGNDAVSAEAQDGSPFFANNAAFSTPPDGVRPRVQMGIFTSGTTIRSDDRDSSFDGQVLFHEYGHGVTTRIVGNRIDVSCVTGTQGGALGEGWSDYFSISFFSNPVESSYVARNLTSGIRRQSYEGYTFTYEDLGNLQFETHLDGEIWAATLWDLRKTLGQTTTDRLVLAGLKSTPCRPHMIDARDGILAADQAAGGANRNAIWQVFARHGMGSSASALNGSFQQGTVFNAAFDQPPDLQPGNHTPSITSQPPVSPTVGQVFLYDVNAIDADGDALRYELTEGPADMTIDPATGLLRWTASFPGRRVRVTVTDGRGGRIVHGFFIAVFFALEPGRPLTITGPKNVSLLTTIVVPPNTPVLQVTLRGGSGEPELVIADPNLFIRGISVRQGTIETMSFPSPPPGRWFIEIDACIVIGRLCQGFGAVDLTASLPVPTTLEGNRTLSNVSGDISSETFYRIPVPPGAAHVRVTSERGTGVHFLYLARGRVPACQPFAPVFYGDVNDCFLDNFAFKLGGIPATIGIQQPQPGDWYFTLHGFEAFAGATITTNLEIAPTLVLSTNSLTFSSIEGSRPPAQTLRISEATAGPFSWSLLVATTSGGSWLSATPGSGNGDAVVSVTANPSGLGVGTYRGTITVNAAALSRSPQVVEVTLTVTSTPVISLSTTSVSFQALPGADPSPQNVSLSFSGGGGPPWTAVPTTTSGGNWLVVTPSSGTGSATLVVSARASGLQAGVYNGSFTISATGASNSPQTVSVQLTVGVPVVLSAVVNAGSFATGRPLAVGEIASLFGSNFIDPCSVVPGTPNPCPTAPGFPLPTELRQTRVTFVAASTGPQGVQAPLLLVSPTQINLVVPFGLTGPNVTIIVTRGNVVSAPVTVPLAEQSIGLFSALSNGAGAGIILHADLRLVSRDAPIATDEVVIIYGTGMGDVSPAVPTGQPAPSSPLSRTIVPMRVLFDGGEGTILFSGLAPFFAGLYQMNIQVPSSLARMFPLVTVQSTTSTSNTVSAGGPSVLDITPSTAKLGADVTVAIRGINFGPGSALRIGGEDIGAGLTGTGFQTLTATIPGRLLGSAGEVQITVIDILAPNEAPSNPARLTVTN